MMRRLLCFSHRDFLRLLFIFFLPVYALLKKSKTKMVVFVVGFSLYFYYKSSGLFFLMLIGTSLVDWLLSHAIAKLERRGPRLCSDVAFSVGFTFNSWIFQVCQLLFMELEPDGAGEFPAARSDSSGWHFVLYVPVNKLCG